MRSSPLKLQKVQPFCGGDLLPRASRGAWMNPGIRTGTALYGNQAVSSPEIHGFADRPHDRGAVNAGWGGSIVSPW